jgi:hypothetical protein
MPETALRVVYRPVESDLPNGSLHYDDPEEVDLVEWDDHDAGEYAGRRVKGQTDDGMDVVVFLGSGRVRGRTDDDGTFDRFLGYADELRGVSA